MALGNAIEKHLENDPAFALAYTQAQSENPGMDPEELKRKAIELLMSRGPDAIKAAAQGDNE